MARKVATVSVSRHLSKFCIHLTLLHFFMTSTSNTYGPLNRPTTSTHAFSAEDSEPRPGLVSAEHEVHVQVKEEPEPPRKPPVPRFGAQGAPNRCTGRALELTPRRYLIAWLGFVLLPDGSEQATYRMRKKCATCRGGNGGSGMDTPRTWHFSQPAVRTSPNLTHRILFVHHHHTEGIVFCLFAGYTYMYSGSGVLRGKRRGGGCMMPAFNPNPSPNPNPNPKGLGWHPYLWQQHLPALSRGPICAPRTSHPHHLVYEPCMHMSMYGCAQVHASPQMAQANGFLGAEGLSDQRRFHARAAALASSLSQAVVFSLF